MQANSQMAKHQSSTTKLLKPSTKYNQLQKSQYTEDRHSKLTEKGLKADQSSFVSSDFPHFQLEIKMDIPI